MPSVFTWIRAYPRGCGGTCSTVPGSGFGAGLSPRVRGNLSCKGCCDDRKGPIPAGAGEPHPRRLQWVQCRAYPRGCGGTSKRAIVAHSWTGLSPRVRGNLAEGVDVPSCDGPIPAGAGEPWGTMLQLFPTWAYPRGCGGTCSAMLERGLGQGLSPRVRGNRVVFRSSPINSRPIPAGAGEPLLRSCLRFSFGAYPRGCGGTVAGAFQFWRQRGLSPRVRGTLSLSLIPSESIGPIPAGAGEPKGGRMPVITNKAYPRGCGGTTLAHGLPADPKGLSPRVRGNRKYLFSVATRQGPIPAGAGEPRAQRSPVNVIRAYPRGCGGTNVVFGSDDPALGLSPRVRGNLLLSNT